MRKYIVLVLDIFTHWVTRIQAVQFCSTQSYSKGFVFETSYLCRLSQLIITLGKFKLLM